MWLAIGQRRFDRLNNRNLYVAIFGGSRFFEGSTEYKQAYQLGELLAEEGFNLINGAGPGLMEASAKGFRNKGKEVIGAIVKDEPWSLPNKYSHSVIESEDIFSRIREMYSLASGFIVLKGGTGTFAELAVVWNLLSLESGPRKPLILLGNHWFHFIKEFYKYFFVTEDEKETVKVVKTTDEVISVIRQSIVK